MNQAVVDDLLAQRDAILFGQWGRGPDWVAGRDDNACLKLRELKISEHQGLGLVESCVILGPAAEDIILEVLKLRWGWPHTITSWNDMPGRTREEVLDVLDEAIRTAKELSDAG